MKYVSILSFVIFLGVGGLVTVNGQDNSTRNVTLLLMPSRTDNPVDIVNVKIGRQNIVPGTPSTVEGDEWIDEVSVTLRYVSNKTLTFTSINIDFPETGAGTAASPVLGEQLQAGIRPAPVNYFADGKPIDVSGVKNINIEPGQEITLTQPHSLDQQIKLFATKNIAVSNVHKIRIFPLISYFSDGTRWAFGSFQAPDETGSNKYHDITANQFYGRTNQ